MFGDGNAAGAATEIVTVLVSLPALFVAVTTKAVDVRVDVGVPEN